MDLFSSAPQDLPGTPLPERMRPQAVLEVVGQPDAEKIFRQIQKSKKVPSLILWGPPGTGKTSFALALIGHLQFRSRIVNAIEVGSKLIREIGQEAREHRQQYQQQTVVFIDEIHRLNKSQQDVLLPFVERGEFILIGATTENPSYDLNRALLSRCQLVVFERLKTEVLRQLLHRGFELSGVSLEDTLSPEAVTTLLEYSDGDARKLLSALEQVESTTLGAESGPLSSEALVQVLGARSIGYDKKSDQHYDTISAFIKSIRGSDPSAGLYYLARMLKAGENPLFIARRLVVLASEDVGNADPRALSLAIAGAQAVELIGLPEAAINLAQVVTYLASAPKSNRSYIGLKKAQEYVEKTGAPAIPLALRSAKTSPMKELGYGVGYKYPHDFPKNFAQQSYFPEGHESVFYEPGDRGFEKQINEYLKWLKGSL